MTGEKVIINSRNYDHAIRRSWECDLIERQDSLLKFVGLFSFDVSHTELGEIAKGTISYEYYWLDRWYNIFAFHEPDGTFRNYYCNINMPPVFADGVLDYVDLDIDIVVWPDKTYKLLDLDEYDGNAEIFNYPVHIREKVTSTVQELIEMIESNDLPVKL